MSNAIKNSIIAKQILTILKDITGQLRNIVEAKQPSSHRSTYGIKIDESKITPEMLQEIDNTLIQIYTDLFEGITVELPERTHEAVQPPFSINPAAQQFFSVQNSYDMLGGFHSTLLNTVNRPTFANPAFMNDEDRRLLARANQFVLNMRSQNQTFLDLYCEILEKEPDSFIDKKGGWFDLIFRKETGELEIKARTNDLANDWQFFKVFTELPITRVHIEPSSDSGIYQTRFTEDNGTPID